MCSYPSQCPAKHAACIYSIAYICRMNELVHLCQKQSGFHSHSPSVISDVTRCFSTSVFFSPVLVSPLWCAAVEQDAEAFHSRYIIAPRQPPFLPKRTQLLPVTPETIQLMTSICLSLSSHSSSTQYLRSTQWMKPVFDPLLVYSDVLSLCHFSSFFFSSNLKLEHLHHSSFTSAFSHRHLSSFCAALIGDGGQCLPFPNTPAALSLRPLNSTNTRHLADPFIPNHNVNHF